MAFSSFAPTSMSMDNDEKHLSSLSAFVPRRTGKCPGSPKRSDCCSDTDAASSTEAGDDIQTTFVDLCSDSEVSDDCNPSTPRPTGAALTTCVYSVMMLLRLRASVCEEEDLDGVRYSACATSELPAPTTTSKHPKATSKARAESSPSDEVSWWRQPSEALPTSSAESWVAQQRNRNLADDENVTRAARSILNKLTVEKFESLFEQLTTCGIKEPHHISILMREVFEKATTQHHFIPMYAELCVKLEKDPRIVSVVEEAAQSSFRRLLLNECQNVFEQLFESRTGDVSVDEDIAFRRKQQALGNMKLIGQLLVHGMLSSDLFVACCEELLRKRSECTEALESLVALMMVAGPKFDKSGYEYYCRLQKILSDMNILTKEKTVPARLRFLIRDVLDARDAGWPSSTISSKRTGQGPSKLEEVAKQQLKDAADTTSNVEEAKAAAQAEQSQKLKKTAPWKARKQASTEAAGGASENAGKTTEPVTAAPEPAFKLVDFRRALGAVFSDLASDKNIPAAVQKVREQKVPASVQADQFVDILTRIVEERRGAVRRCELAFIAGLAAAENSAFDRKECLAGIELFFKSVYADLCDEVHRLPAIMKSEFMPTMLNVFPASELNKVVPASMRK